MTDADREHFIDAVERYDNLMEAAGARAPNLGGIALDPARMNEMANLVGPSIAALHAAGVCAELLAHWAGVPAAEIEAVTGVTAQDGDANVGADIAASPQVAIRQILALHQAVASDLTELGAKAVAGVGE